MPRFEIDETGLLEKEYREKFEGLFDKMCHTLAGCEEQNRPGIATILLTQATALVAASMHESHFDEKAIRAQTEGLVKSLMDEFFSQKHSYVLRCQRCGNEGQVPRIGTEPVGLDHYETAVCPKCGSKDEFFDLTKSVQYIDASGKTMEWSGADRDRHAENLLRAVMKGIDNITTLVNERQRAKQEGSVH